ncbi:hypothetical protein A1O1_02352 [Capronia coronata CBS 617.96]|uniref:Uncharacterized protein n=1 Tax=Capronia coronata CBS 617.96 TaxID=1182541 RepID=W9ZHK4_9EURO|nr:uncharacterized protein A1O1_02352 [Capronia coronata CBS 617.96]EXJ93959.1 hypothetical protein A1O1_02352 [Capronia coronata CBS 617.96]
MKLRYEGLEEIRTETDDPSSRPLPDFQLLEMQWILNRVTATSGAAEQDDDFQDDTDSDGDEAGDLATYNPTTQAIQDSRSPDSNAGSEAFSNGFDAAVLYISTIGDLDEKTTSLPKFRMRCYGEGFRGGVESYNQAIDTIGSYLWTDGGSSQPNSESYARVIAIESTPVPVFGRVYIYTTFNKVPSRIQTQWKTLWRLSLYNNLVLEFMLTLIHLRNIEIEIQRLFRFHYRGWRYISQAEHDRNGTYHGHILDFKAPTTSHYYRIWAAGTIERPWRTMHGILEVFSMTLTVSSTTTSYASQYRRRHRRYGHYAYHYPRPVDLTRAVHRLHLALRTAERKLRRLERDAPATPGADIFLKSFGFSPERSYPPGDIRSSPTCESPCRRACPGRCSPLRSWPGINWRETGPETDYSGDDGTTQPKPSGSLKKKPETKAPKKPAVKAKPDVGRKSRPNPLTVWVRRWSF